jgi:methylase of polypeptide subunit release factors
VPDSADIVAYSDLVEVDPATLEPSPPALAGWEAVLAQVTEHARVATAGASSATQAAAYADEAERGATAAAATATEASDLAVASAALAGIEITPSPDYPGSVLRISYPAHVSPAPNLIRLPIGA